MADQGLHQCRLWIDHVQSSVKRCRSVKDRSRLWKVGGRDRVRDICCPCIIPGSSSPLAANDLIEINSSIQQHGMIELIKACHRRCGQSHGSPCAGTGGAWCTGHQQALSHGVGVEVALVLQGRPAPRTLQSRVPTSPVRTHQVRGRATQTPPVWGAALA